MEPLLDIEGAAAILGVNRSWLDCRRVKGEGPAFVRIGGKIKYRREDLADFIAKNRVDATNERDRG